MSTSVDTEFANLGKSRKRVRFTEPSPARTQRHSCCVLLIRAHHWGSPESGTTWGWKDGSMKHPLQEAFTELSIKLKVPNIMIFKSPQESCTCLIFLRKIHWTHFIEYLLCTPDIHTHLGTGVMAEDKIDKNFCHACRDPGAHITVKSRQET